MRATFIVFTFRQIIIKKDSSDEVSYPSQTTLCLHPFKMAEESNASLSAAEFASRFKYRVT